MSGFLRLACPLALAVALTACDRKSASVAASPTPASTPEPGFAGVNASPPPSATPAASATSVIPATVAAPTEVNLDAGNEETRLVKAEVLSRIDLMPSLSAEEKDKLYVQVERARGMGRIVTIPFPSGGTRAGAAELAALKQEVGEPQIRRFTDDPTVIFVVLGFADRKGDPKTNLSISLERAEAVVKALKDSAGVMNITHAVGMGSSELFDAKSLDKNRVVEVWAVLP